MDANDWFHMTKPARVAKGYREEAARWEARAKQYASPKAAAHAMEMQATCLGRAIRWEAATAETAIEAPVRIELHWTLDGRRVCDPADIEGFSFSAFFSDLGDWEEEPYATHSEALAAARAHYRGENGMGIGVELTTWNGKRWEETAL